MLCVKAFDLLDRGSGVFGEIEDVHPPLGQDDPHADGGVPEGVDCVVRVCEWIVLDPGTLKSSAELTLNDPCRLRGLPLN